MGNKVDFRPYVQCLYDLYIRLLTTERNNKGHAIFMLHCFLCNSRCKEMPEIASGSNGKSMSSNSSSVDAVNIYCSYLSLHVTH